MDKVILTDVDGVLLLWNDIFHEWMNARGWKQKHNANDYYHIKDMYDDIHDTAPKKYTKLFNESAYIGFLPPLRDSVEWTNKIFEDFGYKFHAITSLSLDPYAKKLREINLKSHFGDIFTEITCLDTGADKDHALLPYKDSGLFWVEDKYSNFEVGLEYGLKSLLMHHNYNKNKDVRHGHRVQNWEDVYRIVADFHDNN